MDNSTNDPLPNPETDDRFPSGPWIGYFLQPEFPGQHWMRLELQFASGKITGVGQDWVGRFHVQGNYELATGRCELHKQYLGRHQVDYKGFNEGRGIWGTWQIPNLARGGFHIWPKAMGDLSQPKLREEEDLPLAVDEFTRDEDLIVLGR